MRSTFKERFGSPKRGFGVVFAAGTRSQETYGKEVIVPDIDRMEIRFMYDAEVVVNLDTMEIIKHRYLDKAFLFDIDEAQDIWEFMSPIEILARRFKKNESSND